MKNEKTLREGSIGRLLLSMSLPVILVMMVNVIYNMADVFFLGKTGDAVQVAAVSLAGPLFAAFSAINTLLGFGACTASSMALGRGEGKRFPNMLRSLSLSRCSWGSSFWRLCGFLPCRC